MPTQILHEIAQVIRGLLGRVLLFGIAAEVFYKPMDYDTEY